MGEKRFDYVVCVIAKDENPYMLEWASYHLALGFKHIFVYDNESRIPLGQCFSPERAAPFLTFVPWRDLPGRNNQRSAYADFLSRFEASADWAAVIDIDELINLKLDDSIADFISRMGEVDAVALNWRIFGSSNLDFFSPVPVLQRFTRASEIEFRPNRHVKTISRLSKVVEFNPHSATFTKGSLIVSPDRRVVEAGSFVEPRAGDFAIAQINHYFCRSKEEWAWKIRRGDTHQVVRTDADFERFDRNEVDDRSIVRRLDKVYGWMKYLAPAHVD